MECALLVEQGCQGGSKNQIPTLSRSFDLVNELQLQKNNCNNEPAVFCRNEKLEKSILSIALILFRSYVKYIWRWNYDTLEMGHGGNVGLYKSLWEELER
jgi:hypothetical protein